MGERIPRRARARALVVPGLMSASMWVVAGEAVVVTVGWPALLVTVAVLAVAGGTRVGERWVARVVLLGRSPRLHQRHTLATVARVLMDHGVTVEGLVLLVGPGAGVGVTAVGRRTVVVSRGLVEAVRSGRLGPVTAAAVVAHELGVVRAGLTRGDPGLVLWLLPWKLWLTFVLILWEAVATFLPRRLMVSCLVITACVGLWRGTTEHPGHYVSTVAMAVVLATWWAVSSWERARARVGDHYLTLVGLGHAYAAYLDASFVDHRTRDRAVRLQHPDLQDPFPADPAGSVAVPVRAVAR
ncbi:hypothetical protein [Ornithinimicrobium sp. LYQ103]|uniref:hypothetical protein n=1 Tax=Ornithinimicrobium sp. LYQ103 TaxID=3378796 RepID=UPI003852925B